MDRRSVSGLAAVDFVHIASAIFKSKGYIFRKENADKMRLLRNIGLLHACNYSTDIASASRLPLARNG